MNLKIGDKVKVINHLAKGVGEIVSMHESCLDIGVYKVHVKYPDGSSVVKFDTDCVKMYDSFDEIYDGVIQLDNHCEKYDISLMLLNWTVTYQHQFCEVI
jgi:hypothetical protein